MTEERQNAGEGGKSGQLKIFFGYAAGVGKTYAMLQAALTAEERGMDVVIGSIAPYHPEKTGSDLNGRSGLRKS